MTNQATVAYFWEKITTSSEHQKTTFRSYQNSCASNYSSGSTVLGLHSSSLQVLRYGSGSVFLEVKSLGSGIR